MKWSILKRKIKTRLYGLDSGNYWENRYVNGGNSGCGSYNQLSEFKAEIINEFVKKEKIKSVVEWGVGDCNQLALFHIKQFTGFDGSGRLQSVYKDVAPRYHALINAFHTKTGVPILLNTSFNENEPIVNAPQHALDCYLRTSMDMLVLGNILVIRS